MEGIIKFFKENAGLVIGIGLITIMLIAYAFGSGWFSTVMGNVKNVQTQSSNTQFSFYDTTNVSGSDAINAIRNYVGQNVGSTTFTVTVKTGTVTVTTVTYTPTLAYAITDPATAGYIDPTANFHSVIGKNGNGVTTSITLTQY